MKILAYIVYLIWMFVAGFVLAKADLGVNTWQYWILVVGYVVIYISAARLWEVVYRDLCR